MLRVPPHIRVSLTFRSRVAGGREGPAQLAIYRPDARFPFDDRCSYGIHFLSEESIEPGESTDVDVWIRSSPEVVLKHVGVGSTFTIHEGTRVVADATIVALYGTAKTEPQHPQPG